MVTITRILGNTQGIRDSILLSLEEFYDYRVPSGEMFTEELCTSLVRHSEQINREIALYVNRKGIITHVMIGDQATVSLSGEFRDGNKVLSGIRCLHTHPSGTAHLSQVDISALRALNLDAMIALANKGQTIYYSWAHLRVADSGDAVQIYQPQPICTVDHKYFMSTIREYETSFQKTVLHDSTPNKERALLVGVISQKDSSPDLDLGELYLLSETAGLEVVGSLSQKQKDSNGNFYVGFGKAKEIALLAQCLQANVIVTDDELSPSQIRRLEELWGLKVIDRTSLILDIFAQRARTKEGKLQVELAQLKYLLPRLIGHGTMLSRQGGGIGTRGPGETKLETDRRAIRMRITDLEDQLAKVLQQRAVQRKQRQRNALPVVSLVGYTNAGKTSLMSLLTSRFGVESLENFAEGEDKLFATLDPTTRKLTLPSGQVILLTDTVGFVQKLPHQLVTAFRATLEEVLEADLLLHVVDVSHPRVEVQNATVMQVLRELGAGNKAILTVFNKSDLLENTDTLPLIETIGQSVLTSVVMDSGINDLIEAISRHMERPTQEVSLLIPYAEGGRANYLFNNSKVLEQEFTPEGTIYKVQMALDDVERLRDYIIHQ